MLKNKITLLGLCIVGLSFSLNAQIARNSKSICSIENNNFNKISLVLTSNQITSTDIKTETSIFSRISMDGFGSSSEVGKPELPVWVGTLEIPLYEDVVVNINAIDYQEYDAGELDIKHEIYPAQPSYAKSLDGPFPLVMDNETYQTDVFFDLGLAKYEKIGVLRNANLANIYFSPVCYNPVTKKVRVYKSVSVEILFQNPDIPATYQMKALHNSVAFSPTLSQILNPVEQARDAVVTSPIKYLIVAHSSFAGLLDEFVAWKRRKGFLVEIAYTSNPAVGTTYTSIAAFIKSHYTNATTENPAPSFLLLVGDVAQIPAFPGSGHVTDLYYATWTEGDNLPDCFYGRFSAQNQSQLMPQIAKTLMYEQYTIPSTDYLNDAVIVAGTNNGSLDVNQIKANGQMNYLNTYYVNTAQGYNNVYFHQFNCSDQAAQIRNEIGQGVGYANYTAHCSSSGWSDPVFSTSQVDAMQNLNKYGLMIGNCCQSNKFNDSECFGEKLLRVAGKGAVGYIGGSNLTYWSEDFYWSVGFRSSFSADPVYNESNLGAYDRWFHTHGEPNSQWCVTNGALIIGGNMAVQASTSSMKPYYWEIYHLMGDPSVMTYLKVPSTMTITVNPVVAIGESNLSIIAAPYSYVALTKNNGADLVAAGFADVNGSVLLTFDPLTITGSYELTASAQNYITSFTPIIVIVLEGPHVVAAPMNSQAGSLPNYSSTAIFQTELQNFGLANASQVYVKLNSLSPDVVFLQDSIFIGSIAQGTTYMLSNISATIAAVEDLTPAQIVVTVYFDSLSSTTFSTIVLNAPKITGELLSVSDLGNHDGIIDPGETVQITVKNNNMGHADVEEVFSGMVSHYSKATMLNNLFDNISINAEGNYQTTFNVAIASDVPIGTTIPLYYKIGKWPYIYETVYYVTIGNYMETFESVDFNTFNWNNSSNPWEISTTAPYQGIYCAKSKTGLTDNGVSTLQITVNIPVNSEISYARKVSSELSYDFFKFYIDDHEEEALSGTVSWGIVSFPVSAGNHTFKFTYEKDYSMSSGSDCAWIDNVVLPLTTMAPEDSVVDFPPMNMPTISTMPEILLYPNPTQSTVTISHQGTPLEKWELFDAFGRFLMNQSKCNDNQEIIDLSKYASGIYFVKLTDIKNHTITKKIIKH